MPVKFIDKHVNMIMNKNSKKIGTDIDEIGTVSVAVPYVQQISDNVKKSLKKIQFSNYLNYEKQKQR